VGLCGLDAIYYGNGRMPEENTKGKYTDYTLEVGGPAANAAITFSRLGGEAYLVTALGDSEEATLIKSKLKEASVKVIDLSAGASEMRSGVSFIYVNTENGNRTIFSGQNSSPVITNPDFEEYVKRANFVLYDGNLPIAEQKMIQYVEYHDKDLIIDAGSYKSGFAECFYRSTAVISSESFRDPSGCDVFALRNKYGFKYAAMSRGEDPILYDTGSKKGEIALPKVEVQDTLGAGDVLHGAYCYFKYMKKYSFLHALRAAGEIASLSVECRTVNRGLNHAIGLMSNQLDTDINFKEYEE
jgi:sugar/nucleoside kinase (ribokinase family)